MTDFCLTSNILSLLSQAFGGFLEWSHGGKLLRGPENVEEKWSVAAHFPDSSVVTCHSQTIMNERLLWAPGQAGDPSAASAGCILMDAPNPQLLNLPSQDFLLPAGDAITSSLSWAHTTARKADYVTGQPSTIRQACRTERKKGVGAIILYKEGVKYR